jgi:LCP family protein required for cell wall assembly
MRSRLENRRTRRKVRWGRVFLLLFVLLTFVAAFAGAAYYTYSKVTAPASAGGPAAADKSGDDKLANRINILILGVDDGDNENPGAGKRSDSMILASIDPASAAVSLLSIPRDTRVTIPGRSGQDKIAHAFAYGGPELAARTVSDFLAVPVSYYIVVNWQGFIQIVDILGGVGLYVEKDMNYDDPYAHLSIHLQKGYQYLDGAKAGQYIRYRHDELGDIGRVQRQQRFLKALAGELFQAGTILKLPALTAALREHVVTDMSPLTMLGLANTLKGFRYETLHSEMLPGNFATIDKLSYWVPDKAKTQALVQDLFAAGPKASGSGVTRNN